MVGRIDLKSGTIIVHGRRFTVETGTVTFLEGGDMGNPIVVASAYWDAPDRTRVWVEFVGPLKTGRLTLRSEPPYSKNEILSVLLFGRPDPNMAAPGQGNAQGNPGSGATAVGSGFVAGDLNRMLSELDENLDIETDTLSGNRTRTKLGRSFFDRRLKVQVGYAPGRTYREPDSTFVFLNWQFIPKWSLQATRGDRGTSILDVLFQHRY
jgi:translocation and assembly module TamB